jgi:putative acetyltransferase
VVTIRPEIAADADAVRRVHALAFAPSAGEARLVDGLRVEGANVPDLCLVAEEGRDVVGHVMLSRAALGSGHVVLVLAPVAVAPERQGAGIGSALVREALARAGETRYGLVVLLGHPAYYPRFGFEPAGALGVESPDDVPSEAWMAYRLPSYEPAMRGLVTYADAFAAVR